MLGEKVVLVTGASGGLGSAVTDAFLQAGASVAGVARSIKQTDSVGDRFLALAAELSNLEQARGVVSSVVAKWGRVDVLVHLVGGFEGGHSVAESDDAALDRMIGINVKPAYSMLRAVLPVMREQGSGAVLAIGAIAEATGHPLPTGRERGSRGERGAGRDRRPLAATGAVLARRSGPQRARVGTR